MNKAQIIAEARRLVSEGQIEKSLVLLIDSIQQTPELLPFRNLVLHAKSSLEKTQSDESRGLVSFDNAKLAYNQITNQTLRIIDGIETGKVPREDAPRRFKWWWVALPVILVGGIVAIALLLNKEAPEDTVIDMGGIPECPEFDEEASFKVLVLPFQPLDEKVTKIHTGIIQRLSILSEQYGMPTSARTLDLDVNDNNKYPSSGKQAANFGNKCASQLVIWGTTESKNNNDIVLTRFKFLNLGEQFKFTKLKISEGANVDTLSSISSITTEGVLTEQVEANMRLIFGLIAREMHNEELATKLLASVEPKDSAGVLLRGMALADTYLSLGQTDKAIASYNEVLETHPNYGFARNNRGVLLLERGLFAEAATDLSNLLAQQPNNLDARAARATAYVKADMLEKAGKEIESIERIQNTIKDSTEGQVKTSPKVPSEVLAELKKEYQQKVNAEELKKIKAEQTLKSNPNDVKALEQKAVSSRNLGDYRTAAQTAERILTKDPDNPNAHATLIESKEALLQPEAAKQALQNARDAGVTKEKLIKIRPVLKEIIKDQDKKQ
ncbi:MAG: tetratricopeptide repeat protein [Saprospiraceae bacterium]|nr:tetratricopeptide repeat protein [Saprospiraceae bacterium]